MRMRYFVVGAALGVLLWSTLAAPASADSRAVSRYGSVPDRGISSSALRSYGDPRANYGTSSTVLSQPQRFDPAPARSRYDGGSQTNSASSQINHGSSQAGHAQQELRKFVRVSAQNPACHPRGRPPRGFTSVGFSQGSAFGDQGEDDDDQGENDDDDPPFCPSPH